MKKRSVSLFVVCLLLCSCADPAAQSIIYPDSGIGAADAGPKSDSGLRDAAEPDAGPWRLPDAGFGPDDALACLELSRCMASCEGLACGPECTPRAGEASTNIYSELSRCARREACETETCLVERCGDAWDACVADRVRP